MSRFSFVLVLLLIGTSSYADDVNLRTSYLENGQEVEFVLAESVSRKAHQISVSGQLGGTGILILDGNACTVNRFGDRSACTKVFHPPIAVKIQELPVKDPLGTGRKLFSVDSSGVVRNYAIRLVVPGDGSGAPRLLLNPSIAPDVVLRILTLEPGSGKNTKEMLDFAKRESDTKVVRIKGFAFDPPIVTINVGDSVKWVNEDDDHHTATRKASPAFDTGLIGKGEAKGKTVTFNETSGKAGFEYICSPHPFMKGRVVVLPETIGPEVAKRNAEGLALARRSGCLKCHSVDDHKKGPAYSAIADRYRDSSQARSDLIHKIKIGGKGNWTDVTGGILMPPHSRSLSNSEIEELVSWLLDQ